MKKFNLAPIHIGWKSMVVSAALLITGAQAKTWTSADGSKTFKGELASYDAKTGSVKVTLPNGKKMSFNRKILSKQDIEFLAESQKQPVEPVSKAPNTKKAPSKKSHETKKSPSAKSGDYYNGSTIFQPRPEVNEKKPWNVQNFGPVGLGIDLVKPNFTMVITNVEEGSPAAKTGKLKKGQIIESINGQILVEKDPREILGDIITQAEATDGKISLKIKDAGTVLVTLPVMGAYSKTWPENCPKSDKIVRKLADYLAAQKEPGWGAVLFMLSTGEEKDLKVVRKWMAGIETIGEFNWHKGFKGHGLCEYYLRTGDKKVLPVIKKMTEELKANMYRGAWSGRGGPAHFSYGTVHAAGAPCATFLILAKVCGVDVDEQMFNEVMKQFYRYAGHGNVAYGDGYPEGGFRDNGKTGALAMTMAAAALLSPEGEESVYAKARDNSAMKSFYGTNWFHAGHTGGGIGEIWHHKSMHLVREKRPVQYRSYMDTRRWVMELSRRFDGTIGIAGMTDGYDKSASHGGISWGNHFALTYTLPRKHLQMFGAPRSKWAKHTQLPERFWGNAADDIFQSLEPAKHASISAPDLLNETVENDASLAVLLQVNDPKVSDETLLKYVHHPEFGLRVTAMRNVVRHGRFHLVLPLLKSEDARLRYNGILAITGMFKGKRMPDNKVTPEMFKLVGAMIENPNESWWVVQGAVNALARAEKSTIVKHMDRLIELLDSESIFIEQAAATTLSQLATDPSHYKQLLPLIVKHGVGQPAWGFTFKTFKDLSNQLKSAKPEIQSFAKTTLREAYEGIPAVYTFPGGTVLKDGPPAHRKVVAKTIGVLPGTIDFILKFPKKTVRYMQSKNDRDLYSYSGKFTPDKSMLGDWKLVYFAKGVHCETVAEAKANIKPWLADWKAKGSKPHKSKYGFSFEDGGKVRNLGMNNRHYPENIWTKGMLIGKYADQALEMHKVSVGGVDFMILARSLVVEDLTVSGEDEQPWKASYALFVKGGDKLKFEEKTKKKKKK